MSKKAGRPGDHILGDMVSRAQANGVETLLLRLAYSHLQAYDLRLLVVAGADWRALAKAGAMNRIVLGYNTAFQINDFP